MLMIGEFWRQYAQYIFAIKYHGLERKFLKLNLGIISIISLLVTMVGLAAWGLTQQYAVLWIVIILFSQVVNNLKDQFQYNKRVWALGEYLCAAALEKDKMVKCWRQILLGELREVEILDFLCSCAKCFTELEVKYITPFSAVDIKMLINKADKMTNHELENIHGKGETDGEQTTADSGPAT